MLSRTMLLVLALISVTLPRAHAAGRWDYGFDGGWMRVLLDVDQTQQTITGKVYQTTPGGSNSILIDDLKVANGGNSYVLYGLITSGTFKVGLGKLEFTVGDLFVLTVSKDGVHASLMLQNPTSTWTSPLTWF
jgi:hypothetical protein